MIVSALRDQYRKFNRNLTAGTRLAFFRMTHSGDFDFDVNQLFVLAAVNLALAFFRDFVLTLPAHEYYSYGAAFAAFNLIVQLCAAYVGALLMGDVRCFGRLLLLIFSIQPVLYLLECLLASFGLLYTGPWYNDVSVSFFYVFSVWLLLAIYRACTVIWPGEAMRAVRAGVAATAVWLAPAVLFAPLYGFWYSSEADEDENIYGELYSEDALYLQQRLLEQSLAGLAKQRPGVVDLYFVGFGSYAHENVFKNEIEYIRELFDRRFNTRGRSVALINHEQTYQRVPLATATALERVLTRVGTLLDPKEDVLFLYLTSHGSEQHHLSVEFLAYQLDTITPDRLRDMLERSGIRWAVLTISACYSGGYVQPLQDSRRLIATASAADRQSFGCGVGSDFTYFGDAVFRQALQRQTDFIAAFEQARQLIAAREKSEGKTPSLPQLSIGADIGRQLQMLQQPVGNAR
jgi:hypothetical protein